MSTYKVKEKPSHSPGKEHQLLAWLQHAHQTLKSNIAHAYKSAGQNIGTEQFSILSYLHKNGQVTQTEISKATRRERASISRILTGLEKKGLVERLALDKRTNGVSLTAQGTETFHLLSPIADEIGKDILSECSQKDIETTMSLLKIIAASKD